MLVSQACLLTEQFGLTPTSGTEGRVVRSLVTDQTWIGFYFGVLGNCQQAPDTKACMMDGNNDLTLGITIISLVTPGAIDLVDDRYYTNESVAYCVETARDRAILYTYQSLDGTLKCRSLSGGRQSCFPNRDRLLEAAVGVPLIAAPACELRQTGVLVSVEGLNIF